CDRAYGIHTECELVNEVAPSLNVLVHGGDLVSAAKRYGVAREAWIDLSTGINPCAYPVPHLEASCFQQLPYQSRDFEAAVTAYYGSSAFVACNGSQQVIELLPKLLPTLPVLLPALGYQEHCKSWRKAQRGVGSLFCYSAIDQVAAIERIESQLRLNKPFHLVLINPNNPTGLLFSVERIVDWASRMPEGGFIIVDEAFIDLHPEQSVLSDYHAFQQASNLLVIRSFGKFFGLAGIRLGFLFGPASLLRKVAHGVGPWSVNGPAQSVAIAALNDHCWHGRNRASIERNSDITVSLFRPLLTRIGAEALGASALFSSWWINRKQATSLYTFFAERGVLLRIIDGEAESADFAGLSVLRLGSIDAEDKCRLARLTQVINDYILALD
ncbi:aminotransferase class I/II-fold pyridoxal phosphate-dependent enzyme, partial [Neptuniibacter pectenicola]|uniref:aminotransferase class I/II-fold pyridoxal phosphate-dependent enzyme n=1 Tax=Neptuniibacter pectenicola TaxID=1806669 RepID=UPI003F4B1B17